MAHKRKPRPPGGSDRPGVITARCPACGKIRYLSRKDARVQRKLWPGVRLHAYRCGDFWHVTTEDSATTAAYKDVEAGTAPEITS